MTFAMSFGSTTPDESNVQRLGWKRNRTNIIKKLVFIKKIT